MDVETPHLIVGIDSRTGAIRRLYHRESRQEWASTDHLIALFSYQTLSQDDYSQFFSSYVISDADWAKKDFGKPNIERFGAESREWFASLKDLQTEEDEKFHRLLAGVRSRILARFRVGGLHFRRKCTWRF